MMTGMELLGDFFQIEQVSGGLLPVYTVVLNADHVIFKAHFPGNPIVPGVCTVRMVEECFSDHIRKPYRLYHLKNIKFLNIISPLQCRKMEIRFLKMEKGENNLSYHIQAEVGTEKTIFAKMSMLCRLLEENEEADAAIFLD